MEEDYKIKLNENIHKLMSQNQLTPTDFERKCSIGRGFVLNLPSTNTSISNLVKISNTFNISTDYLLGLSDVKEIITSDRLRKNILPEDKRILDMYKSLSPHDKEIVDHIFNMEEEGAEHEKAQTQSVIYRLPVYEQDVAAGAGQLGFDQKHHMEEFEEINMSSNVSYGVKIVGNSMETDDDKNIPDKSIVLVDTQFDYSDLSGQAVIVNINGKLVCKEYNIADDGHLWLKSRNRDKSDEDRHIHDLDCVKIIGRVVKVISS